MKYAWLVLLAACGNPDLIKYETPLFQLGTGYNAKEVCSCLYVSDRDEDECKEWTRVSPDIARFRVDEDTQTVTSKALGGAAVSFRYESEETGCVKVIEE